jgi:hypothetical protein
MKEKLKALYKTKPVLAHTIVISSLITILAVVMTLILKFTLFVIISVFATIISVGLYGVSMAIKDGLGA